MSQLFPPRGASESNGRIWLLVWGVLLGWLIGGEVLSAVIAPLFTGQSKAIAVFGDASVRCLLLWLLTWYAPRLLGRPSVTLIRPGGIQWRRLAFGFALWLTLQVGFTLIDVSQNASDYRFSFNPANLLLMILLALFFLPLQTSAEELYFRGLLTQAVGRLTQRPVVVIAVSAFVFAGLHLANPEAQASPWSALLAYGGLAVSWGYACHRSGGLEIALGAHLANNIFGLLIVGYEDSVLPATSIWTTPAIDISQTAIWSVVACGLWMLLIRFFTRNQAGN